MFQAKYLATFSAQNKKKSKISHYTQTVRCSNYYLLQGWTYYLALLHLGFKFRPLQS